MINVLSCYIYSGIGERRILVLKRKRAFGIMLMLVLTGTLMLAFNIQPAKASGTIYIRADGSIDPPTANITRVDNVTYIFTGNNYNEIVVERDNIVIDGAGYKVRGVGADGSIGIDLSERSDVTIKNMEIKTFQFGIKLDGSSNNNIVRNNITANSETGIWIPDSSSNTVSRNNITDNIEGVWLFESSSNNICENNIVSNEQYGIGLGNSYSNNIYENDIANNRYGIGFWGGSGNNCIYHNDFVNNIQQAYLAAPLVNSWDDGYPSGGNYWSDYAGVDVKSGPNQDLPGSDGIGDTSYIIDENNRDRYPLMNPYGAPPPPTYALTITTTTGGTTNPAHGTYTYTANSTVQVTAISNANYLFDHWELDAVNVGSTNPYTVPMNKDHTLKAVFSPKPAVPVGGYSLPIKGHITASPLTLYLVTIAILATVSAIIRRKIPKKK
jgi:parallel beta-helix repeat protein